MLSTTLNTTVFFIKIRSVSVSQCFQLFSWTHWKIRDLNVSFPSGRYLTPVRPVRWKYDANCSHKTGKKRTVCISPLKFALRSNVNKLWSNVQSVEVTSRAKATPDFDSVPLDPCLGILHIQGSKLKLAAKRGIKKAQCVVLWLV